MNKKIITLGITTLFIMISFSILFNNSNNQNNSLFNPYSVATTSPDYTGFYNSSMYMDFQNYTLPNYDYSQFDSYADRASNLFGNAPIFTRNNVFHTAGFVYINITNDLVFFNIKTKTITNLSYMLPVTQAGRPFYGEREWLHYYQLPNGSLYDVWTVGQEASVASGNPDIVVHYFYNQTTTVMYELNMSFASGTVWSTYQITNTSFWSSATSYVASGLAIDYINTINTTGTLGNGGHFSKGYQYYGFAVADTLNNSAFAEVSTNNNGTMMMQLFGDSTTMKQMFNIINVTTKSVKWVNTTFTNTTIWDGANNVPFTFKEFSNGTILYYEYEMASGKNLSNNYYNYGVFEIYFNPNSETIVGQNYIFYGQTHTLAWEMLTNDPYISYSGFYNGMQYNNTFQGQELYSFLNQTRYYSNNSWLNSLTTYNGIANAIQLADASTNDYASYLYTEPTSISGKNPNVTVFWLPEYTTQFNYINNLTIKENGLPSGTNYTYDLNGTSYTVNTPEQNYTFQNGNYSLSVTNITGYTVKYSSIITIDNANVIAYINFSKISTYGLTLKENGLPSGTSFTYTFNGNSYTLTNNSYKYILLNGTYSLSVTNVNGYNVVYPSSIKIAGANQTDYINFSLIPTYTLFVKENGLVNGTTYHIFVGSTEYSSSTPYNNVTGLTNGTYDFKVDTISGYLLSSYPTSFTINGANDTIDITFTKNASTYNVNIIENGLVNPVNIKWSVVFNGTTYISANSNSITIGGILNGSYSFKVNSVVGYVIDKYNTTLVIKGNTIYNIYFNETFLFVLHGLNINVFWAITFNSSSIDESNNYVNLSLVNQTFSLSIIVPTGYSVSLYPKTVTINGKNVYLNVTFSKITITAGHYIVTLYIEGYNGNWSISINNEQYYSMHSEMNITLTNGTYIPIVALPSNYQLQPLQPLVVNGNNTVYVIYAKAYFNWVYYEPYIAIILLVLAVLIIPAVVRRS